MFDILDNGAILLGNNFTIDGHYRRLFRVITHFHSDHLLELDKSIKECSSVIATPITLDAASVLGYTIPKHKRIELDYGITLDVLDEKIKLEKADHIMGASQVVVKSDNVELAYTGDFKNPGKGTPILNPDVLIIDATYGNPAHKRPYKHEAEILFSDYIRDALIQGPVRIFGYYGKLQEAMKILRQYDVDAPFIVAGKVKDLTNVAIKHGIKINDVFDEKSKEGKEIMKDGWYISFKHATEFKNRDNAATNFLLDGWIIKDFIRRVDQKSFIIGLSSHADFQDTIYYIENTTSDIIVVDGSRSKYAKDLVEYARKNIPKKDFIILPRL
ncbi:MBL fold metallo-hydrolase [Sulfurisphaera ohwakuensis]|uniref:MBL fold metallo-hydrolase n=1 Tax=Sulfurisphaera ohwakuensis TaxID=69656 RepID=A0A650CDK7_SULOH|nr:MBL fold metallo-hydrolase [Sulfurisphaera ohwakuensis]MBB5253234.1 putative mRNA 3-end processing factor [Sulfurisphaera ohwakuensis]QGR15859.1 MBL fold metallo-hydrolase [Sulfurisphaera ohwakuensis]